MGQLRDAGDNSTSILAAEADTEEVREPTPTGIRMQQLQAYLCSSSTEEVDEEQLGDEQRLFLDSAPIALSKSAIFPLLEQYYKSGGKVLWEQIPFYITSNPFIAEVYADIILSFLLDCHRKINKDEPLYLLEIGTGTGCFSFYLLKELSRKLRMFDTISGIKLKYVMCDFSTNTIQSWLDSGYFTAFQEEGLLDFAVFKPEEQTEIVTHSGTHISSSTAINPLIVIANYFFDSLKQDAFQVRDNKLHTALHHFYACSNPENLDQSPLTFASLRKLESYEPVKGLYYGDPVLDSILARYEKEMHDATVLFPLGPLRCLENLRTISNGKFMLLSTDKGFTAPQYMTGLWEQPFVSHDGIFSYPVNYDAIGKYFEHFGGHMWATDLRVYPIETAVCVMLGQPRKNSLKLEHTNFSFQERVLRKNQISDVYQCQRLLMPPKNKGEMMKTFISFIRMNNYDPIALYFCAEQIYDCLSEIPVMLRQPLLDTLEEVEKNVFHVRRGDNTLYYIGRIRYKINDIGGAISSLKKAMELANDDPQIFCHTLFYLAACYEVMEDFTAALDYYQRSLKLDSECSVTGDAVERVKSRLSSSIGHSTVQG